MIKRWLLHIRDRHAARSRSPAGVLGLPGRVIHTDAVPSLQRRLAVLLRLRRSPHPRKLRPVHDPDRYHVWAARRSKRQDADRSRPGRGGALQARVGPTKTGSHSGCWPTVPGSPSGVSGVRRLAARASDSSTATWCRGTDRLKQEIGYNPTRFVQMVCEPGVEAAARCSVAGTRGTASRRSGNRRLEMSIKAFVLLPW